MVKFPDTSINSLMMLALAIVIASVVSVGLQVLFENPSPESPLQFVIGAAGFVVGFGFVYGWAFYRSYRAAEA